MNEPLLLLRAAQTYALGQRMQLTWKVHRAPNPLGVFLVCITLGGWKQCWQVGPGLSGLKVGGWIEDQGEGKKVAVWMDSEGSQFRKVKSDWERRYRVALTGWKNRCHGS